MSERRVVYVGGISERYTRADLRKRFGGFGEIEKVMIFLRENSENYGFVTFYSKADAHAAIESKLSGHDSIPDLPLRNILLYYTNIMM